MKMYKVDSSNKYVLRVQPIENIEEAGDDFTTEDELREMLQIAEGEHFYVSSVTFNKNLIIEQVAAWKAKIPQGNVSIVMTDTDLVDALKEMYSYGYRLGDMVPNIKRVGDRLFATKPKERKTNKNDFSRLISAVVWSLNQGKKYDFKLSYTDQDRAGSIALLKKLITWDEILFARLTHITEEDKVHMREVWDNPTMFDKQ